MLAKAKYQGQLNEYSRFSKKMGIREERERIYIDNLGRVAGKVSREKIQDVKQRLSSSKSYQKSLEYIRNGKAGLSKSRKSMLRKVSNLGEWASLKKGTVSTKDIAYLSAYTKHEFAIWESTKDIILRHGTQYHCNLPDEIYDTLLSGKYKLVAHTHIDMGELVPSVDDRNLLKAIGQKKSTIVSIDGREREFSQSMFD